MSALKLRKPLLVLSLLLLAVPVLAAESDPEDVIKYRKNVMKANGAHMAAMAAILQNKVRYRTHMASHARAVQAGTDDILGLFPKGSDFGDTEALDAVWQKRPEFDERAKDTRAKAKALVKAIASNDPKIYEPRFRELSDSCKACHKDFRKEQK